MAKIEFNARTVAPSNRPTEIDDQPRDTSRVWSAHQNRIFDFVENDLGNAIVKAVAGSGKTTTIVEALKRVRGSSIFLAFNKSIAEELKARGVNARTFHSLTYSPVTKFKKVNTVDANKIRKICDAQLSGNDCTLYGSFVNRLVGLARQVGMGCLIPDTEQAWMDIVIHHDLEPESEFADLGRGISLAQLVLIESNKAPAVDFDDLLYLAVKEGISLPKFDFVFVDEAQDTNAIQRAILRKIMHAGTRIIAVGDPAQAIYGFRGSDSDSLDLIRTEFNCIELPLTISYRCPQAVVNFAHQWVTHIEAAPSAPEGEVIDMGFDWKTDVFQANDLVVCRTTKPIIQLAYKMLRARVPVRIMGKEIGQGLKNLINKMRAHTLPQLESKLVDWCTREVEKATAKMEDSKAAATQDKVDAILCLMQDLHEGAGIYDLMNTIDSLFAEGVNQTVLSTIHKAKGLEANRVFWLNSSQCPAQWARGEWQQQQELNLCYVAVTRAKQTLILIEEKQKERN
jgi:DNA helicase-2/ATP-dependent DNA helicase PcrA